MLQEARVCEAVCGFLQQSPHQCLGSLTHHLLLVIKFEGFLRRKVIICVVVGQNSLKGSCKKDSISKTWMWSMQKITMEEMT